MEADKMLSMGLREEMDNQVSPPPKRMQTLLFSATLSPKVSGDYSAFNTRSRCDQHSSSRRSYLALIKQIGYRVIEEKRFYLRHLIESMR
jgi:superfamily II DNA/RNA helicase